VIVFANSSCRAFNLPAPLSSESDTGRKPTTFAINFALAGLCRQRLVHIAGIAVRNGIDDVIIERMSRTSIFAGLSTQFPPMHHFI